uniref:Transposase Tc1-like domain-containing protein n=1 Tax=Octopus bimaculoides TaxID=37653 RepID=A0A0L8I2C5_OCTBM
MRKRRSINPVTRSKIVLLHQQNVSFLNINKQLGCSKTAYVQTWKLYQATGQQKIGKGRALREKTTVQIDWRIHRLSEGNRMLTAVGICKQLSDETDISFTPQTVRNRLKEFDCSAGSLERL